VQTAATFAPDLKAFSRDQDLRRGTG